MQKSGQIAAGIVAGVVLIGAGVMLGTRLRGGEKVVTAQGGPGKLAAITERPGLVAPPSPITGATGQVDKPPPQPTDIIDYLKFLKEIERRRTILSKSQLADLLKQSGALTMAGATADWTSNEPEERYKEVYTRFQQSIATWSTDWQTLSQQFLAYPRPVPAACGDLRNAYYDLLGKTAGAMTRVGSSFSQAMQGDPSGAIDSLTKMQGSGLGSASGDVSEACTAADGALAAVCDKFRLRKDFDIRDDSGGAHLLSR